ncbi:MAG: DUF3108 domain-containing protein [Elusimicrobiota bacterium]
MIKFITKTVLLFALCFCANFVRAEELCRRVENNSFQEGEKLEYLVKWGVILVGYATLEIRGITEIKGRRVYHIFSQAHTTAFFDNFFKVRDTNESWVDVESLCSWQYEKHLQEGRHKNDQKINYDQLNHLAYYKENIIPINPYIQDTLSSLYWLRTQPLNPGQKLEIDVNTGKKNWPLVVKVDKKTKVDVPAGKFKTIIVEPFLREEGIFKQKGRMKIWLTDDARKIPVLMSSKVFFGSITAELATWREK